MGTVAQLCECIKNHRTVCFKKEKLIHAKISMSKKKMRSSLVAQWVKDPALSLLGLGAAGGGEEKEKNEALIHG